jgi:superfamily II DNA/RNA helicase
VQSAARAQVAAYTADLSHEERTRVQRDFMEDRTRVLVATTAFGMGVNKRDIRWVRCAVAAGARGATHVQWCRESSDRRSNCFLE